MTTHTFDIVVLGGGSGGYAAALRASELGKSVALIEKDKVGGTCLHRGCIPTKALLHAAEVADHVRDAASVGVTASFGGIDPAGVRTYREGIVAKKYKGLEGLVKARGITTVAGLGRLNADRSVTVGDDVYVGTDVILATGSYSRSLPGLEIGGRILTSEQALALDVIPERVLILGGGVIGVEFASVWRSFGAEVTIVEALPHLVPNEDIAMSKGLERAFRRRGIQYSLGVRFQTATQDDSSVTVTLEDGKEFTADYLLVAVGRGPATADLGFEEAGVRLDRGFVTVDGDLRTGVPGVWAVGDIVPGLQLAHRGFQQGIAVAERIAGLSPVNVPDVQIPKVTYSSPEVASVGLTEEAAVTAHGADAVHSYEYNLAGNGKSEIIGTGGLVKVVRLKDGPVLGVHLLGDRVGELITEGQLAVAWEAHPEDIAPLIHAHPTQSEALGEAFLALAGKPLHAL
ncbi:MULTISPECIES: dihydrolipoyl dehydrogenase [unclassified Microbacterium]|uniref:dihydrolipoyl dehydrogenase n=1 Tax=unclassified Microbacterium TaxID=2609290 RepID=UPI001656E143|nr:MULTISPECIES: dihydrolipoyl dehydrogenase [unclassified Microbacterium]MDH5133708.1 dihydrolipoyl dehydrogenase [Microbacterium sp. RD10]MDH5135359.1 dihydrolipoyl dehydrogenase [Microbacterium sp. RD11]MDH5144262.1 dihydrolipoyl dehydrogenase [Microbacterium sp. RD12]MDH5155290.1 dihydrolipoyl dehydrogenase [Microbacterium sp. RD06]MDH5165485.1 dihydrolipoyl dehydrogenase [Microbacterium sp. RD02]